jgi:hypothetical protein
VSNKIFGDDEQPELDVAARLRAALTSEAAMVDPSDDGLSSIRDGLGARRSRPWWQHPAAPAAAAAVVLAAMIGGIAIFAGGGDGKDDTVVGTDTSSSPAPSASSSRLVDPEPSDPPMTGTPRPIEGDVFVYYVMDDGQSPRLYREQRPSPGSAPVTAALSTMLAQPANDPDYSCPWPPGTALKEVTVSGDTATVDLSDFPKLGAEAEALAVQQLVYTVTANDKTVKNVLLLVNGRTPASGHLDLSQPISRAPMTDVQGWIWLLSPAEGATVSSPVTITGYGTAFEGTISWEVLKMVKSVATDTKVASGHTQGGSNGEFGDFTDTVDLQPGTYQLRAFESSAEDGSPIHVDTKVFTVK